MFRIAEGLRSLFFKKVIGQEQRPRGFDHLHDHFADINTTVIPSNSCSTQSLDSWSYTFVLIHCQKKVKQVDLI